MPFENEFIDFGVIQVDDHNVKLFNDPFNFNTLAVDEEIAEAKWVGKFVHVWLKNASVRRYSDVNVYSSYTTIENIEADFLDNLKGKKVMIYVSSTDIKEEYRRLPYDYVILNNKEYFDDSGMLLVDNKIILIPYDNNRTLRILKDAGITIKCFVGIRDGCIEGGNNECVNTSSFFSRLSPILNNEALYITDHFNFFNSIKEALVGKTGFLNVHYEYMSFKEFGNNELLFDETVLKSEYLNFNEELWVGSIKRKDERIITKTVGNIQIMISQASLWDHENDFDCIIYGKNTPGNNYYLPDNTAKAYLPISQPLHNPEYLLTQSVSNKWKRIGLVPFMKGDYSGFVDSCKSWKEEYPEIIHFFHLEDRDMLELRADLANWGILTVAEARKLYGDICRLTPAYLDFFGFDMSEAERMSIAISFFNNRKVIFPFKLTAKSLIEELDKRNGTRVLKCLEILLSAGYRKANKGEVISRLKH